jgi:uncharacterized protein YndB with AHSA1/START domain
MPSASSEARLALSRPDALDDRASFVCAAPALDSTPNGHRIRARRVYHASAKAVFDAWTTRAAWQTWLRLRSRSRASIAAYVGGAFRLEVAEGPTIHVITGDVIDIRVPDFISLSWTHHGAAGGSSTVDVFVDDRADVTELVLIHHHIDSRRDASWSMRLWSTVLDRLDAYLAGSAPTGKPSGRFRDSVTSFIIVR